MATTFTLAHCGVTLTVSAVAPPVTTTSLPISRTPGVVGRLPFGLTVMVNVRAAEESTPPLAVPPVSRRTTVTVAVPVALASGMNVRAPVAASMVGWAANRAPLVTETANVSPWPASSAGPREMALAHPVNVFGPVPAVTVRFAPGANDGASFTAVTVTASVVCTVRPPASVARTVSVADPLAFAAGVSVSVPPDTDTVPKRAGLVLPTTAYVSPAGPSSTSLNPPVSATAVGAASSSRVRGERPVVVGASFTGVTVTVNWRDVVSEPSPTVTVMVALPLAFASGAKESVPVAFGVV